MGGFEEKLNELLSNPDAMAQIAGLAQSLNLGGGQENGGDNPASCGNPEAGDGTCGDKPCGEPDNPPPSSGCGGAGTPDLGALAGLGGLFGQIDPKMLQKLLPLVSELTGGNGSDERLQLLYALKPFLKPERRDKVDRAVKAARLIHVGKKLLQSMGESYV